MTVRVVLVEPVRSDEVAWWQDYLPQARVSAPESEAVDTLVPLLEDATVAIARRRPITADLLGLAPQLRLLLKIGRLTRPLDMEALAAAGVEVVCAPNPAWVAVAEHAMLLMLAVSRALPAAHAAVLAGARPPGVEPSRTTERAYAYNWVKIPNLRVLLGQTLGLVGFGEIGREVAVRARAFGMHVVYHARTPATDVDAGLAEYRSLEALLTEADVVSLHVPHTPETDGLLGREQLALLRPHAVLVNTARGGVVDQDALVEALEQGRLAGAGLDVFREEPLPPSHPLSRLPNVVLTPHIGAVRIETMRDPFPGFVRAVQQLATEQPTPSRGAR